MFEYLALFQQALEMHGLVARNSRPEDMVVRALHYCERIDLHIGKVLESVKRCLLASAKGGGLRQPLVVKGCLAQDIARVTAVEEVFGIE